jgi:SM-20-related protein
LEQIFNALIDTFIDNKVGIAHGFLNQTLSAHLRHNLQRLYEGQQLKNAGTGNDSLPSVDRLVRSDKIYWLDREHNDPYENEFFGLMDAFVLHLNNTCYTGITGYEFHYALYEKGSFYKKHIDQFRTDDARQYSMILYLNEDWASGDGGELCIYHEASEQYISPENGKSVFFKSSGLAHEVMLTHKARISITGWLKKS